MPCIHKNWAQEQSRGSSLQDRFLCTHLHGFQQVLSCSLGPGWFFWLSVWLNWNYWGITVHLWSWQRRCFQKDLTREGLDWAATSHSLGSQDKKKERGESQPNSNIRLSAFCSTQVQEILTTCFSFYKVTCHCASVPCWTRSTQTVWTKSNFLPWVASS